MKTLTIILFALLLISCADGQQIKNTESYLKVGDTKYTMQPVGSFENDATEQPKHGDNCFDIIYDNPVFGYCQED